MSLLFMLCLYMYMSYSKQNTCHESYRLVSAMLYIFSPQPEYICILAKIRPYLTEMDHISL